MPTVRRHAVGRGARIASTWWVSILILGFTIREARGQSESSREGPSTPAPQQDTAVTVSQSAPSTGPAPRSRFVVSLGGGYSYQSLYGVPIQGVDLEAVLGADSGDLTVGADIEGIVGSTEYGLSTSAMTVGILAEGHVGRLRIGGGVRLGVYNVNRATDSGSLFASSEGLYARASVDLFSFNETHDVVFLVAKGSVESVGGRLLGAVGGAGVRF
jgi:hypothetical protein